MATKYYVNGGGYGGLVWNNTDNWSLNSGGAGGAGVPTSTDDVVFDTNSPNCTLDINGACNTIVTTSYTGTLDLNGYDLTVEGDATFDGTNPFSLLGGEGTLTVNNSVTGTSTFNARFTKESSTVYAKKTTQLNCASNTEFTNLKLADSGITCVYNSSSAGIYIYGVLTINGGTLHLLDDMNLDGAPSIIFVEGSDITGNTGLEKIKMVANITLPQMSGTSMNFRIENSSGKIVSLSGALKCNVLDSPSPFISDGYDVTVNTIAGLSANVCSGAGGTSTIRFQNITVINAVISDGTDLWLIDNGATAKTVNFNNKEVGNIEISDTSTGKISFTNGLSATGNLKVNGGNLIEVTVGKTVYANSFTSPSSLATIHSSISGTTFNIDIVGTSTFNYLSLRDCNSANNMTVLNGVDEGGNSLNISFESTPSYPTITVYLRYRGH